jgi:prepilin-type N-terminal cleavage/methylation domain-containing protein
MKKGFTLVELLVVVAILGILAAVGIVSFGGFTESAKINTHKTNEKTVADFMKLIFLRCEIEGGQIQVDGLVHKGSIDCSHEDSWGAVFGMNNVFAHYFDGVIENALNSNETAFIATDGIFSKPEKYFKFSNHDGKFILTFGSGAKGECNSNIKNETVTSKNCFKIVSRLPEYPDGRKDIDLFMHHW